MKMKLIAALCAAGFALITPALVLAADTTKSEETKPPMYTAKCQAPCSFSVRSHDRAEVVAILKEHARAHHEGLALSDEKVESMVKTVEPRTKKS